MRLLALDASLRRCSAALLDGPLCLGMRWGGDSRAASSALPELVQGLLAEHGGGMAAVGVTVGPGSFTGLRAALAFAHGLALGSGLPIVGVGVAEALRDGRDAWVALDARRGGQVFLDRGGVLELAALDALPPACGPVVVVGDAADAVVAALRRAGTQADSAGAGEVDPKAVGRIALRRLRGELPPCALEPLYAGPPAAFSPGVGRPAPA